MAAQDKTVTLPERDFYGSRLRCLLLTHQPPVVVAERLTELAQPFAVVNPDRDRWAPSGFSEPAEVQLDKAGDFLSGPQQQIMSDWWLAVARRARTPTWPACAASPPARRP